LDDALHVKLKKQNIYIICVVARKFECGQDTKSTKSKAHNIIKKGIKTERLMWPRKLREWLSTLT
jgi:hypothetical protein